MKLIKQFNDCARLNEELENQEILTPDQMKAIADAAAAAAATALDCSK